uniref:TOX high mobility group box family member 4 b n=1 Tax=Neogobius melanostomus TaxID=47308 RepID=A0A8C6S7V0_9GOBI
MLYIVLLLSSRLFCLFLQFPGSSDNYLSISGSGHHFLSSSEVHPITFHTPSLGDEEFEIPPISLDPDTPLSVSDVVSHFGELADPGASGSVVVPENSVVEGDDPSFASTFVNSSGQGLEHLSLGVMNQSAGSSLLGATLGMDLGHPMGSQFSSSSPVTIDVPLGDMSQGLLGSSQLTTIDQSELSTHLGLGLGGGPILQRPQTSLQDDDMDDFRSVLVESPVSLAVSPGVISLDPSLSDAHVSAHAATVSPAPGRKAGNGARKNGNKKPPKDPNKPKKPVSAYALFFKDTQAAIKGQNPNATFGEVSKIVASMWDSLGEEQKQVYKRKNDAAKKDYLKALAEYKANQLNQTAIKVMDTSPSPPPPAPIAPAVAITPAPRPTRSQHYNPEENTITNICTSNIIVDLPQVTTRSRTGAIKPVPLPPDSPPSPPPPTVTKIIIKSTPSAPPPPPPLQQMVHAQTPPPLQAKPRGGASAASMAAPPPLQIKVVPPQQPSSGRQATDAVAMENKAKADTVMLQVGGSATVVTKAEDGEMEVEVNVAPVPTVTPAVGPSICVRAGCTNRAVESKDWDKEYCSNECVATHCRDVFMAWCAIRGQNSTTVA